MCWFGSMVAVKPEGVWIWAVVTVEGSASGTKEMVSQMKDWTSL